MKSLEYDNAVAIVYHNYLRHLRIKCLDITHVLSKDYFEEGPREI
jgi:hypothetical protein